MEVGATGNVSYREKLSPSSQIPLGNPSSVQHPAVLSAWETQGTLHKNMSFRNSSPVVQEAWTPNLQARGCNPWGAEGLQKVHQHPEFELQHHLLSNPNLQQISWLEPSSVSPLLQRVDSKATALCSSHMRAAFYS